MISGVLQFGFIAGLFHSLQNTTEKLIFNKSNGNINDYYMLRLTIMTIIFGVIYVFFPSVLNIMSNTKMDLINFTKLNYGLVITASCFVLISIYFMGVGISRYDISVLAPIFLISYLLLNVLLGIFLFKEPLTLNKIIGLFFAITSIILFNIKS
jgi:drug/metabolite transporter (DMT)-like permease